MTGLVVLLLAIAVVVLAIVLLRKREQPDAPVVDPFRRESAWMDVRRLKVGDVVHHEARDYIVRGSLDFDEGGFRWNEFLLDDATQQRWLSVEDDEQLELVLYERLPAPELSPGAPELSHAGVTYTLDERGEARYTSAGATGTPVNGTAEYVDYRTGDDRFLAFERFAGEVWEVSVGRRITEGELQIYPASK